MAQANAHPTSVARTAPVMTLAKFHARKRVPRRLKLYVVWSASSILTACLHWRKPAMVRKIADIKKRYVITEGRKTASSLQPCDKKGTFAKMVAG
jgi:hypothetical protein